LRRPLGALIRGSIEETGADLLKIVRGGAWWRVVAVGDAVTRTLLSMGFTPDVSIVDGKIERRPVGHIEIDGAVELRCKNRPGTISDEAYDAVVLSLGMKGPIIIRVDGEEDLLGLVVMAEAPAGTLMLYGQPSEGVVVVTINEDSRGFARKLIEESSTLPD